ncbi:hypothetical protein NC652_011048 [Populus alba x Populus x berolinensis]|nr:hypothetical protein NC652_011048 [Populus alba x Populus x berolinensis]
MHPLSTAAATSFLSTLLLFLHLTASSPSNDTGNLSNCYQTFSCGALTDITYPFTGGQRPPHCGPPEFQLTCFDNSMTTLTANSLPHRVTKDLGDHSVEEKFKFQCGVPGYSEEGLFKVGDHPPMERCWASFQVPFLRNRAQQLEAEGSSLLGEVLKEGFDVRYSDPYSADCQKCSNHSGRQCGFDAKPICICNDHLCPGTGSSRFGKGLKIATGEYKNKNPIFSFDDDDVHDNNDDYFLLQPYQQLWQ